MYKKSIIKRCFQSKKTCIQIQIDMKIQLIALNRCEVGCSAFIMCMYMFCDRLSIPEEPSPLYNNDDNESNQTIKLLHTFAGTQSYRC